MKVLCPDIWINIFLAFYYGVFRGCLGLNGCWKINWMQLNGLELWDRFEIFRIAGAQWWKRFENVLSFINWRNKWYGPNHGLTNPIEVLKLRWIKNQTLLNFSPKSAQYKKTLTEKLSHQFVVYNSNWKSPKKSAFCSPRNPIRVDNFCAI